MKLSVVMPARNEAESIAETIEQIVAELEQASIDFEIVVIDDSSSDGTGDVVRGIAARHPGVRCVRSRERPGFGRAVRAGLGVYRGDAVAVMMADLSDSPADLVRYYRVLELGYDCAFGTRFGRGGLTSGYPLPKLILNRILNAAIRTLFRHGYNDTTNAFKAYRRGVIDQVQPLVADHFNLTVELPLKAVIRGYSYAVVPISWTNRRHGASKLKIWKMGGPYVFSLLQLWLEQRRSGLGRLSRRPASTREDLGRAGVL